MTDRLKIESEMKAVQAKFAELGEKRNYLNEQIAGLNRNLSEVVTEQVRVQGEFRILEKILKDEKPETVN